MSLNIVLPKWEILIYLAVHPHMTEACFCVFAKFYVMKWLSNKLTNE